jgi:hypothetical protein
MHFIEPMLLLSTEKLPERPDLQYEIKFDGYRALAIKSGAGCSCAPETTTTLAFGIPASSKQLAPCPMNRSSTERWWSSMKTAGRRSRGQEFVIAGYTPSPKNFDALVIGYEIG